MKVIENRFKTPLIEKYLEVYKEFDENNFWEECVEIHNEDIDNLIKGKIKPQDVGIKTEAIEELLLYKTGVTVHIEDVNLIKVLMKSKFDSMLADVKIPFPVIEFAFPINISLFDDYEISSVVLYDRSNINMSAIGFDDDLSDDTDVIIKASVQKIGEHEFNPIRWIYNKNLDIETNSHNISSEDNLTDKIMIPHFRLIMALLLYCQYHQDQRALMPLQKNNNKAFSTKRKIKENDKKRKHKKIVNLLPDMEKKAKSEHQGGTHSSPTPHQRGYVWRTLRHSKFKRNPDGSCKVIMIKPCIVGLKSQNSSIKSDRKLFSR